MDLNLLFENIFKKGVENATTASVTAMALSERDPRHRYAFEGGVFKQFDLPPAVRDHRVDTIDDLCAAIERWGVDPNTTVSNMKGELVFPRCVVFIAKQKVTLVLDDTDRHDHIELFLEETPIFKDLQEHGRHWFDQTDTARRLRRELRTLNEQPSLLSAVRNIRWTTSEGGAAVVDSGKSSVNMNVERQIRGIDQDFPEFASMTAACYVGVEQEYPFELTVDVDLREKKFRIAVVPGQLEECQLLARKIVQQELWDHFGGKDKLTVLLGAA